MQNNAAMLRLLRACLMVILIAFSSAPSRAQQECNASPTVTDVYPTASVLPENLLRFYVYFSEPISSRDTLSHLALVNAEGEPIEGVFLDNQFELWSPDNTRLTLLFDPGRVKSGLVAHNRMGRALAVGKSYSIVVSEGIRSQSGCAVPSGIIKSFRVDSADTQQPDLKKWQIEAPKKHSKEAVSIRLNGIYDHVSLAYRLRVASKDGEPVPGRLRLREHEQVWEFTPNAAWSERAYDILVDPTLEDIAGNRMTGQFEQPGLVRANRQNAAFNLTFHPVEKGGE